TMVSTFQLTRSARLRLAHQRAQRTQRRKTKNAEVQRPGDVRGGAECAPELGRWRGFSRIATLDNFFLPGDNLTCTPFVGLRVSALVRFYADGSVEGPNRG